MAGRAAAPSARPSALVMPACWAWGSASCWVYAQPTGLASFPPPFSALCLSFYTLSGCSPQPTGGVDVDGALYLRFTKTNGTSSLSPPLGRSRTISGARKARGIVFRWSSVGCRHVLLSDCLIGIACIEAVSATLGDLLAGFCVSTLIKYLWGATERADVRATWPLSWLTALGESRCWASVSLVVSSYLIIHIILIVGRRIGSIAR